MTRDGRQNDTPLLLGKSISLQVLIPTCFAPRITTATMRSFTAENYDKGNDHPCYKCAPRVKHRPYDKCQVCKNG